MHVRAFHLTCVDQHQSKVEMACSVIQIQPGRQLKEYVEHMTKSPFNIHPNMAVDTQAALCYITTHQDLLSFLNLLLTFGHTVLHIHVLR